MSQVADVSSTSLLGCKQASDRDTGRSRCAQRAAQDLRAAQVERHPLGAARQIGKMLHQRSVPMKFSMVYRFNQPPVWNFLCQQHCLLDQFVFRCNWRYSGATCDWWFSVKVLTPLYYLFPFQVGILPSNQPWVPRRCRCAKWNVIQLTDPDRTWKGISIAIPMCVCVLWSSHAQDAWLYQQVRDLVHLIQISTCVCNSDVCANVHPTASAKTAESHLVQVDEKKRFIYYAQQEQPLDINWPGWP